MPRWTLIDEFIASARANDVDGLERHYNEHAMLVNALDRRGWNALACAGGKEATAWLLEHGAVSPPQARGTADAVFIRFVGSGNLLRAREHVEFIEADLAAVENHHQSTPTTILHRAVASPEMTVQRQSR